MNVECYRNLHTGSISVREAGGRVLDRADTVFINSPEFVVRQRGRERVVQERQKNVHAFVRGELRGFSVGTNIGFSNWTNWSRARYNPYVNKSFVDEQTGRPISRAARAVVTVNGVYYDLQDS